MKYKFLTAALAAFLMLSLLATTAYAGGGEGAEPEETVTESAVTEPNPFTPDGTGTVLDNATDGDGKEFFTITTEAGNVFYLVIDRQRTAENVYFLNAVTEADLLALAEPSENVSAIPDTPGDAEPEPVAEPDPDAEAEPEPEAAGGGNTGTIILVLVIVLGGGGAGYYLKIYRSKQEAPDDEGEGYGPEDDYGDPYGAEDFDAEPEDNAPLWDEDESEGDDL